MGDVMKIDQVLPRPPGCCAKCVQTAAVAYDALIAVYCRHHQTGAWMLRNSTGELSGLWSSMAPLSAENFAERVRNITESKPLTSRRDGKVTVTSGC